MYDQSTGAIPIGERCLTRPFPPKQPTQVALTDSQYMLVIRGIAVKNMLSRVGLAKSAWTELSDQTQTPSH